MLNQYTCLNFYEREQVSCCALLGQKQLAERGLRHEADGICASLGHAPRAVPGARSVPQLRQQGQRMPGPPLP